jgi:hypothetical protein
VRIALPNVHTLPKLAELLRRTYESGDPMASFTGLGCQRTAGAAGCADDEESQADLGRLIRFRNFGFEIRFIDFNDRFHVRSSVDACTLSKKTL